MALCVSVSDFHSMSVRIFSTILETNVLRQFCAVSSPDIIDSAICFFAIGFFQLDATIGY